MGALQSTLSPQIIRPHLLLFCIVALFRDIGQPIVGPEAILRKKIITLNYVNITLILCKTD